MLDNNSARENDPWNADEIVLRMKNKKWDFLFKRFLKPTIPAGVFCLATRPQPFSRFQSTLLQAQMKMGEFENVNDMKL